MTILEKTGTESPEDPSNKIYKILNMGPISTRKHEWIFINMVPISISKHEWPNSYYFRLINISFG